MKWLFRIIALVFLGFVGLCVAGYFMPASQKVEVASPLNTDAYAAYEVISDLQSYPEWSALGGDRAQWVFTESAPGVGQSAAWQDGTQFGSLEILQAEPGKFVMVKTVGPLGERMVTLALDENEDATLFLIQAQQDTGGFPYIGRLRAWRQRGATQAALDRAAVGLTALFPFNPE